jgi:hypothetical protein
VARIATHLRLREGHGALRVLYQGDRIELTEDAVLYGKLRAGVDVVIEARPFVLTCIERAPAHCKGSGACDLATAGFCSCECATCRAG